MSRFGSVVATAVLVAAMVGGGSVTAAAPVGTADAPSSCGTQAWPTGHEAKGVAFVGRVLGSTVNRDGFRVYRFHVLSTRSLPPGADGVRDPIRVMVVGCAKTSFKVGARYLVSSSFATGHDDRIERVELSSDVGVAWRVWSDNSVQLKGYGPGTDWDAVPAYLADPDTLKEAVAAIRS